MENGNEKFIRWQGITVEERGKTISLILSLSLASLAFILTHIMNKGFEKCFSKPFATIGILALLISAIAALLASLNRLKGFRETTAIARKSSRGAAAETELDELREANAATDKKTFLLFDVMIWTFGIGEVLIILALVIEFSNKLF